MEILHENVYHSVTKIIATVSISFFQKFSPNLILPKCEAGVVDNLFPGWQWRPVNPVTKRPIEEELQPWNTTLPPCGKILLFTMLYALSCALLVL